MSDALRLFARAFEKTGATIDPLSLAELAWLTSEIGTYDRSQPDPGERTQSQMGVSNERDPTTAPASTTVDPTASTATDARQTDARGEAGAARGSPGGGRVELRVGDTVGAFVHGDPRVPNAWLSDRFLRRALHQWGDLGPTGRPKLDLAATIRHIGETQEFLLAHRFAHEPSGDLLVIEDRSVAMAPFSAAVQRLVELAKESGGFLRVDHFGFDGRDGVAEREIRERLVTPHSWPLQPVGVHSVGQPGHSLSIVVVSDGIDPAIVDGRLLRVLQRIVAVPARVAWVHPWGRHWLSTPAGQQARRWHSRVLSPGEVNDVLGVPVVGLDSEELSLLTSWFKGRRRPSTAWAWRVRGPSTSTEPGVDPELEERGDDLEEHIDALDVYLTREAKMVLGLAAGLPGRIDCGLLQLVTRAAFGLEFDARLGIAQALASGLLGLDVGSLGETNDRPVLRFSKPEHRQAVRHWASREELRRVFEALTEQLTEIHTQPNIATWIHRLGLDLGLMRRAAQGGEDAWATLEIALDDAGPKLMSALDESGAVVAVRVDSEEKWGKHEERTVPPSPGLRRDEAGRETLGTVDFGILTIREDEFAAVLERFPPSATVTGRRAYNLHRMELPEGGSYRVAVMRCGEPSNTEVLDAVHDLMEDLAPRWLLAVGIAGGVPSDETSLGDVVVSTRIVDFSVEAALQGGETELALGGGEVHKDAATWVATLPAMKAALGEWSRPAAIGAERPRLVVDEEERFYGDEAWQERTRKALARHVGRTEPRVTAGAIASSDRLMKDTERLKVLLRAVRQVVAVEMESAGVYRGASRRGVPLLAIRGLSDVVGFRREAEWTTYACHTAAAFTLALLRTQPIEPRGDAGSDPLSEDELRRYLAKIESLHSELPLAGFETRVRVRIELDELYVPLDAVVDESRAPGQKLRFDEGARHQLPLAEAFVEARAKKQRGVVLLGDPGSGKTTHLKQVLLKVIRDGPESIGLPKGTVPVFLALRNLRDREGGLPGLIQQELRDPMLALANDFGARMCRRGRLLFLLDGLDEVADATERAEVARWIEQARTSGPDSWFLVTCRYAGYTRDVDLDASFLELHLRPLDDLQVRQFVINWYAIVERAMSRDPARAKIQAERYANDLLETLGRREFSAVSRVYEMTRNPLLLTAICLVHRDRGRLPQMRAQLYDESLMVLLERWRTTKRLPVTLPASQAVQVLQPVALWMHEVNGRTRATTEELRGTVEAALGELRNTKLDAKAFLEAIRDESGLLTGWGIDSFGFMQLGFQEYLAAQRLRNLGVKDPAVMDALARRFDESWWREVILLMLALGNPSVFEELMRAVVEQERFPEWARSEMMDLCLSESARVSAAPFVAVVRGDGREPSGWAKARQWLGGGEGPGVAARQVAALEVLGRAMPEELERLGSELEGHRAKEVREWWSRWQRRGQLGAERTVAARAGVELVKIPAGRFLMGSPKGEERRFESEGPQHEVELESFWLARTPVTNAQYAEYLKANPKAAKPAYWGNQQFNQPQQPVVGVSWLDAIAYCEWAGLRLPTEAQWEYACRAGTTTRYSSGDGETDLARVGWYGENSGGRLHAVGELEPNPWGLYDMHGNVHEWCEDKWEDDYEGAVHRPGDGLRAQPVGPAYCVVRGGVFSLEARYARSASRDGRPPGDRSRSLGFRTAQVIPKSLSQ